VGGVTVTAAVFIVDAKLSSRRLYGCHPPSVCALELALEELQNNAVPKKSRTEENIEKFRLSKKYK
jgi:hypothetical protein